MASQTPLSDPSRDPPHGSATVIAATAGVPDPPPDPVSGDGYPEDDDRFDHDSAIGSDIDVSARASLTSSILHYKYENGRTYHAFRDGQYVLPNDDEEQDRLDLVHHVWRLILGGELYSAPIPKNVQRVLDVGTGTGIWAMEFAYEFPSAIIKANDLSPIQPSWVPPNLQFEIDDVEDVWPCYQAFDYIHVRNMGASIANWPKLCEQSLKHLCPGGYIEIQEHAIEIHSENGEVPPIIKEWLENMETAGRTFGKELNIAKTVKDFLISAGFENVQEDKYQVPLAPWSKKKRLKELGLYQYAAILDSVEAYSLALFTRVLNWDLARLQVFLDRVRQELKDRKNHLYCFTYVVYGRKPLD